MAQLNRVLKSPLNFTSESYLSLFPYPAQAHPGIAWKQAKQSEWVTHQWENWEREKSLQPHRSSLKSHYGTLSNTPPSLICPREERVICWKVNSSQLNESCLKSSSPNTIKLLFPTKGELKLSLSFKEDSPHRRANAVIKPQQVWHRARDQSRLSTQGVLGAMKTRE